MMQSYLLYHSLKRSIQKSSGLPLVLESIFIKFHLTIYLELLVKIFVKPCAFHATTWYNKTFALNGRGKSTTFNVWKAKEVTEAFQVICKTPTKSNKMRAMLKIEQFVKLIDGHVSSAENIKPENFLPKRGGLLRQFYPHIFLFNI